MSRLLVILLALVLRVVAADLDAGHFLAEIRQQERWDGRDGALGERGPYQFREITWRQHMPGTAFAMARHEGPARACALKHLAWLQRELRKAGIDDNAFNLALCWNAGLDSVLRGRAPERAYLYATRVSRRYSAGTGTVPRAK